MSATKPTTQDARIAANRANARKSTGPKTAEGKARARQNARKHGLRASAAAPHEEDARALAECLPRWVAHYRPEGPAAEALVEHAALASVRLRRCAREEAARLALRQRHAAADDEARRIEELEQLVERLPAEPTVVAPLLRQRPEGCDWMIDRWLVLGVSLRDRGEWSLAELIQALHLLGLSCDPHRRCLRALRIIAWHLLSGGTSELAPTAEEREEREDNEPGSPAARHAFQEVFLAYVNTVNTLTANDTGKISEDGALRNLRRLVRREIQTLRAWKGALDLQRDRDRAEAAERCLIDTTREGTLIRRYETAAALDLHRSLRRLEGPSASPVRRHREQNAGASSGRPEASHDPRPPQNVPDAPPAPRREPETPGGAARSLGSRGEPRPDKSSSRFLQGSYVQKTKRTQTARAVYAPAPRPDGEGDPAGRRRRDPGRAARSPKMHPAGTPSAGGIART